MFNPDEFLDQEVLNANATVVVPCPIGEFPGVAKSLKPRQWTGKDDKTKQGVALDIVWSVEDADVKQELGRDEVLVKQGIMLDTLPNGKLDPSPTANVALGRLREALGLNVEGEAFSFNMIIGQSAILSISHRVSGEDIYAEVKRVAAAS